MRRSGSSLWRSISTIVLGGVIALWTASSPTALAEEVTVQNDSFTGGDVHIFGDFVPGEEPTVWLQSPCDGNIVAIQIAWYSDPPGAPFTLEEAIRIYRAGSFPTPGSVIEEFLGPVLTPGALNEFREVGDPPVPISVPVSAGQVFVVGLEFANATDVQNGTGGMLRDEDGCQSGLNALYGDIEPPFGTGWAWYNFCGYPIFLQGDVVMRAVIDCQETPGACCLPSGACQDGTTTSECENDLGGTHQGQGTTCAQVECPQPEGACCFLPDGCLDLTLDDCGIASGYYQGDATTCATWVCFPNGACCYPDGSCGDGVDEQDCLDDGGTFQGDETICSGVECPQPEGACCLSNGNCLALTEADCAVIPDSAWAAPFTDCTDGDGNETADACETGACACGDLDGDGGAVDLADFSKFQVCFGLRGPTTQCPQETFSCADLDGNDWINLTDFSTFQVLFGTASTNSPPNCP